MDPTRRRLLAGTGTIAIAGLAGCTDLLDFVRGEDAAAFDAEVATVADETLAETGYDLHEIEEDVITRDFEAGGQTREVQVTNRMAEYDRAVEILGQRFQAAVFTALSTPQVNVLGRTFNPVGDMDSDDLAEMIQDRYENVHNVERDSEYGTDVLGQETTVVQYDADAELIDGGMTVDLVMHIAEPVEAGDDYVVCLGAYPEAVGDGDNVRRMLNGVEHPGV